MSPDSPESLLLGDAPPELLLLDIPWLIKITSCQTVHLCSQTRHYSYISMKLTYQYVICGYDGAARRPPGGACRPAGLRGLVAVGHAAVH